MKFFCLVILFAVAGGPRVYAQTPESPLFRSVIEKRLRDTYRTDLSRVCPVDTDPVAARVFADYGAIFVSNNGGDLPTRCILESEAAVQAFQTYLQPQIVSIAGVEVKLQKRAMQALLAARADAAKKGLAITPRGGASASTRSFATTLALWNSRFFPALRHWTNRGKIKPDEAANAQSAPIGQQAAIVLAWEEKGYFFSKDLSKSILYSVAVPGASQHIFMLALDVEQFGNKQVRKILSDHGWFQTVKSDLPHFTYLGVTRDELPALGLEAVTAGGQEFWIPKMQ